MMGASVTTVLAASCGGLAAWLLCRPAERWGGATAQRPGRPALLMPPDATSVGGPPSVDQARRLLTSRGGPVLVAGALALILAVLGVSSVLALVAGGVTGLVTRLRARTTARAQRRRRHVETTAACEALAAELAAGMPASLAIERVAFDHAVLLPVAAGVSLGSDVPDALCRAARQPGAEGLADMGAAWAVSARSGASLEAVLDRIAVVLRDHDDLLRELDATLGPPRATARLLAVLPLLALVLGVALGGNPLRFLLGGGLGTWCLTAGVLLAAVGVLWVERITDRAAR